MEHNTDFVLISENELEQMLEENQEAADPLFNFCMNCNVPMDTVNGFYECGECGLQKHIDGDVKDCGENAAGTLRMNNGNRFYSISQDYSQTQYKNILSQLNYYNRMYEKTYNQQHGIDPTNPSYISHSIPQDIIVATARDYNAIQKLIIDATDDKEGKKFVKRGNIKKQVEGYLLHLRCIAAGSPRLLKDIATFMMLSDKSLSKGEEIVRDLKIRGLIDIEIDNDPSVMFAYRYLCALDMYKLNYYQFVLDMVERSYVRQIGMNSVMTSKIVAIIWLVNVNCKLNIPASRVETCCDDTRKNTWMRFHKEVEEHILKFIDIFEKHSIPHGITSKIMRKRDLLALTSTEQLGTHPIPIRYQVREN